MNQIIQPKTVCASLLLPMVLGGCATPDGNQQLMGAGAGAVGGAMLGCLLGYAAGGAKGCAVGAAVGGATGMVAGWSTVKYQQYQTAQIRSAQEDQRIYGLSKAVSSPQVKINEGRSEPQSVRPGGTVNLFTDYSVQLPGNMRNVNVSESWTLKKDAKVLADLPTQNSMRTSGGWSIDASIPIPGNAAPGTYVIEHKIQSGNSYDTIQSTFMVAR